MDLQQEALQALKRGNTDEAAHQLKREIAFCDVFENNQTYLPIAPAARAGLEALTKGQSAKEVEQAINKKMFDGVDPITIDIRF